eukprot:gene178-119_t
MSSMPRMLGEIGRLEDQLRAVQREMETIENNVRLADKRGLTGLEDLSRLDHLKNNMDKCKATLEEYDQWNQIVREARQLLESGGVLSETADRISTMFHSLEVLKNLPGHEDRQENCHKFRSTLLDALRPNVQRELLNMNISALQEYAYVFNKLGSYDEYKQLYTSQRPAHLLKLWSEIKRGESFSEWIALYLGTVGRFIVEEEDHVTELFGADQLPTFCQSMLQQALAPLDKLLTTQLSAAHADVNTIFECYLVLEEFGRRNILTLEHSNMIQRWQLIDLVFMGLWKFLPTYIEVEERVLRRTLYQTMDNVSLGAIVHEYQEQTGLVGVDDVDPMEVMSLYCDRLVTNVEAVLADLLSYLDRVGKFFGGVALKSALRTTANMLQTLIKLLALKIGNVALALGFSEYAQSITSGGGGIFEPYATYLDENNFAQTLSERIFASETSRQGVMAAALHAYKVATQAASIANTVEARVRQLSGQLAQLSQWQHGIDWNSPSSVQVLTQSGSNTTEQTHRLGVWFGQWKLQRDVDVGGELRSFLASCPSPSSMTAGSSGALHYQGIFSVTQMLLQRLDMKTKEMILVIGTRQPEKLVVHYVSEDCWQRSSSTTTTTTSESVLELQSQLLPLSVVTQVGEHLLSLVQELEGFAGNLESLTEYGGEGGSHEENAADQTAHIMQRLANVILTTSPEAAASASSGLSSNTMQQVVDQCVSLVSASTGWKDLKEKLVLADTKSLRQLSDRGQAAKLLTVFDKEAAAFGLRQWSSSDDEGSSGKETAQSTGTGGYGEGAGFVNEWLMLFSDAFSGLLLAQMLKFPRPLSLFGLAQLATDIDYFHNVIHATGIKPHPLFGHVKNILLWRLEHPKEAEKLLKGISQGKSATVLKDLLKLYGSLLEISVDVSI